ncbi:MAG: TonB-dependent receptor, partial [Acidobacteria bacterium]|nr:TonB-dependent receptor [Acidobacteriota bacterium]
MTRPSLVVPALVSAVIVCPAVTTGQSLDMPKGAPVLQIASAAGGTIEGQITSDRGAPLQGVVIAVLGPTTHFAVTDVSGRFVLSSVPAGAYQVRAHRAGYAPSRRALIDVRSNARAIYSVTLRKSESEVGTGGQEPAEVLLAGVAAAPDVTETVTVPEEPVKEPAGSGDDHSERAWRLRHLRRSVLKDSVTVVTARAEDAGGAGGPAFGPASGAPARVASSLFSEMPFSGELNFLTSSTFETPLDLFSGDGLPTGIAHFLLNGSAGRQAEWTMHGAMTHGDVVSWFVAGSYRTRTPGAHGYDLGLSYSAQRYDGGNPIALAAVGDVSRNVGAVYGYDHWTVSPRVWLDYGARYEKYGYLSGSGLFSPRVGATFQAANRFRVKTLASIRMAAPGAEEFVPAVATGLWVPPERTFAPLTADQRFTVERALHYQIGVERDLGEAYIVALRMFHQQVDNQLVALFGVRMPGRPATDLGHYYVANGGDFGARGWGVTFSHAVSERLRGSVDYSQTRASWVAGSSTELLESTAPGAIRRDVERLHDVTTSLHTEIPETSTRIVVLYRLNTGFSNPSFERGVTGAVLPASLHAPSDPSMLDGRFDVQVNQSLPFLGWNGAQWE